MSCLSPTRATSGGAVLRSKLVDGKCQVQSPIALFDPAFQSFSYFLRNSHKYVLGTLRNAPPEGTPLVGSGPA